MIVSTTQDCAKCGHFGVELRYCAGGANSSPGCPNNEHMDVTCKTCRYRWIARCAE